MQTQSTTPPSSSSEPIDYRSVKVHDFRPGSVTVIAVVGVAVAVGWILLQLFVWKSDPSSSYALGQILGLLLLILFIVGFCSSLCCLSLRPWARPGLFIYSIAGGVIFGAMLAIYLIRGDHRELGAVLRFFPTEGTGLYILLAYLAVIIGHLIAAPIVMMRTNVKNAFAKGREYADTAYNQRKF